MLRRISHFVLNGVCVAFTFSAMFTFKPKYFVAALVLLIVEVLIALYLHDVLIRPYGGDYLVVILLYCAVRTFINAPVIDVALGVLLFSYIIEVLQYFHIVKLLGLQHSKIANTVIGNGFAWLDLLAYTLGIVTILIVDRSNISRQLTANTDVTNPSAK